MAAMAECEKSSQVLAERIQRTLTLGQTSTPDFDEIMGFQQTSLKLQHESLASILTYLIKGSYTSVEDFYKLLDRMPAVDKWSNVAVHYVPVLISLTSQYGSPDSGANVREARSIHNRIMADRDSQPWQLAQFQAAFTTWWLAEYSGLYSDQPIGSPLQGVDLDAEDQARTDAFFRALSTGAFQLTLSFCSNTKPEEQYDPARAGLTRSLIGDTPGMNFDTSPMSSDFEELLLEQVETFTDAFITNMPDTLRRFKTEEDDQRRKLLSGLQSSSQPIIAEQDRNLERFLIIMSYAYNGRVDAAQAFWSDPDSNLYGFLQWASRRQSTPCVAAFCELFRSISRDDESALTAHRFLLEDTVGGSSRLRRSITLSWAQIFEELELCASKIREHPAANLPTAALGGKPKAVDIDEPESPVMLECYLRLTAHLCRQSELIRAWVVGHPTFRIIETMLLLSNNVVPSRIRSCAYSCLQSVLTGKIAGLGNAVWTALDQWVTGGFSPALNAGRTSSTVNVPSLAEEHTFVSISNDFGEANAFVSLLQALVAPSVDATILNDSLPFPEQIGSSHRMPGIEPFIDLVMGKVFATMLPQLEDPLQFQILAASCLEFAITCLATFNEDLLILANTSAISVDDSMNTASLMNYTKLHPFSRTMEWLFNEKVISVLFNVAHQNISEVIATQPDSPLVVLLIRGIEIMNLVLDLQSTFLDIVRPALKSELAARRQPVASPSLASFEDAVASNLYIITDLGFFCGSGHEHLVLRSLKLLEKLSSSRKLNVSQISRFRSQVACNRLIGVLQQNNDVEPIAQALSLVMDVSPREINHGSVTSGYRIKSATLDFLCQTLTAAPEKPNIAHVLLGFTCKGEELTVTPDSPFAQGTSLFHAILHLVGAYPDGDGSSLLSWSLDLKRKAIQILQVLWTSKLTSVYAIITLRHEKFLPNLWMSQASVDYDTHWDEAAVRDPDFIYYDGPVIALERFFLIRQSMFSFAAADIRLVNVEGIPVDRAHSISLLLGSSTTEEHENQIPSIFDMFDFVDLAVSDGVPLPPLRHFANLDFRIGSRSNSDNIVTQYNLKLIEEMISLHINASKKRGLVIDAGIEEAFNSDGSNILLWFAGENNKRRIGATRMAALKAWVVLITLVIESEELDHGSKGALVLQVLQIAAPKLEFYTSSASPEGIIFARMVHTLLTHIDFGASALESGRAGNVAHDRLFQLFRISLRAIQIAEGDSALREALYNICYRYLACVSDISEAPFHRLHGIQTVKTEGKTLIDVICDDASTGEGPCKISALLLLDALARLSKEEDSTFIAESLVRTNFIVLVVETLKDIPRELIQAKSEETPLLLAYYKSQLSLLLTVSQTRVGATHILNAGLFAAIRATGLFAADPDLGLEFDNPKALQRHHELLLSVLRVITSILLSCGSQNIQTIEQAKAFLLENRQSMVGVFKRQGRIGIASNPDFGIDAIMDELVEIYVALISLTGFVEVGQSMYHTHPLADRAI
jgi:nuclear pore complex protein Nup205